MPPLHRDNFVEDGFHKLKDGKLTFRTGRGVLAYDASGAMKAGRALTVSIAQPEGRIEVTGKVLRVELVENAKRIEWEIEMKVPGP